MANELRFLLDRVFQVKGVDFNLYRPNTLLRRVGSRLRKTGCSDYSEYATYLDRYPEEYDRFLEEVTINVTEFFRDPETFAAIEERVLPELFRERERQPERPIRVWCAGTSFGEETYSMAILFLEAMRGETAGLKVDILGTDIDASCVEKARAGLYEPGQLKEVSGALLKKYFMQEGERYRLKDEVKRLVEFRTHNLAADAPPADLDLILCRNVMIYFTRPLQEFAYSLLARGLNAGGFLVMGKVETLWGEAQNIFDTIDNRERIYRKKLNQEVHNVKYHA